MTFTCKPLLLATMWAAASLTAQAQSTAGPESGPRHHMARMDPAKMQEMAAKRQAELRQKLNLASSQETAWATYVVASKPGAAGRMDPEHRKQMHDEMQKLTTPERIDRMNAMKAQRNADMARRGDAVKAFYAVLTPEQQKVFDAHALRAGPRHGMMEHARPAHSG